MQIERALNEAASSANRMLDELIPTVDGAERRVVEAMRYATMGGGKRIRPYLVLNSAALFNVNPNNAIRAAAAVEMLHCYSLVHDDLPAMDDSDLRRGRATAHKKFDEAIISYERGALLKQHCEAKLREAQMKVEKIVLGANGSVGTQPMDTD